MLLSYNDFINEKVLVKRKYTENHPSIHLNNAKLRNLIIDKVSDNVLTDEELIDIINQVGIKDVNGWLRNNKSLFYKMKRNNTFKLSKKAEGMWLNALNNNDLNTI